MAFSAEKFPEDHPHMYEELEKNFGQTAAPEFISLHDLREQCEGEETLEEFYKEMLEYSGRYIEDVSRMEELALNNDIDPEEFREKMKAADEARTRLHNALIDSILILVRALKEYNQPAVWADKLGDPKVARAAYGKFALLICYEAITEARQKFLENKENSKMEKDKKAKILQYVQLSSEATRDDAAGSKKASERWEQAEALAKELDLSHEQILEEHRKLVKM